MDPTSGSGLRLGDATVIARPSALVRIAFDVLAAALIGGVTYGLLARGPLVATLLFAPAVAVIVGINRLKVVVAGDRLISCGGFLTRTWARDEIDGFVFSPQGAIGGCVEVVLVAGTALKLSATKIVGGRREAEATRNALNEWLNLKA